MNNKSYTWCEQLNLLPAGYIKALGENVKCKFKIDNPVLAFCGTQNQTSNENDKQESIEDAIRNIAIK